MQIARLFTLICCLVLILGCGFIMPATAADHEEQSIIVVKTDNGIFPGSATGITHQRVSTYQIRKVLNVTTDMLDVTTEARVLIYLALVDREVNDPAESFEVIVNDHVTTVSFTASPLTAHWEIPGKQDRQYAWFEVPIAIEYLHAGNNHIIVRKSPHDANPKDYLYVGIDHTAQAGASAYSGNNGATWDHVNLNAIKSTGEYMIRLALVTNRPQQVATLHYEPDMGMLITDPGALIRNYQEGNTLSIDFQTNRIGTGTRLGLEANVDLTDYRINWLDEKGMVLHSGADIQLDNALPNRLLITPQPGKKPLPIQRLSIRYQPPLGLLAGGEKKPLITPRVNSPRAEATIKLPKLTISADEVTLHNGYFALTLATDGALTLKALKAVYSDWENVMQRPEATELFWLLVNNQQRLRARDFGILSVTTLADPACGVDIELLAEQYALQATLRVLIDSNNEIRLTLQLHNQNTIDSLRVKTVFPHLGGIVISEHEADDYYLFPIMGGVISNKSGYLNSAYGETVGFWQMIDTFSPEKGMGVYVRIDDATGIHKHMSLNKGQGVGITYTDVGYRAPDPEISWASDKLLQQQPGTSVGFGYQARTLAPAATVAFPTAVIGVHAGDWHAAMETYAKWAHAVWTWQPYPSTLTGLYGYNLKSSTAMVRNPGDKTVPYQMEYAELSPGWWARGDNGPWGVPLEIGLSQARALLGNSYVDRKSDWFAIDPVTGKMQYVLNRGDYEYNEAWGGLETLRDYVDGFRASGAVVGVITYPLLVSGDTKMGRQYGERLGVMNPIWDNEKKRYEGSLWTPLNPEGYVNAYAAWNMCLDNEEYHDLFITNMQRLAADLQVGIRVDEMGISRTTCYSEKHDHIFGIEPGDLTYFQGQGELLRKLRLALDEVDPAIPLLAEGPGNDYLARSLTGTLSYNTYQYQRVRQFNPVVYNLVRFYFPEVRLFDYLVVETEDKFYQQAFWQAMPLRGEPWDMESQYPNALFEILKENSDAFDGYDMVPFVPTIMDYVYANRFSTASKTVYQFYNDTGRIVTGALLHVQPTPETHYFDLINLREVPVSTTGTIGVVIAPETAASIAQLPRLISGELVDERLLVSFDPELLVDGQIAVKVYDENKRLIYVKDDVTDSVVSVPAGFFNSKSFRVKLLQEGILRDAIEVAP